MIHVVSVRTGTKYSPEYVTILHDQIARNLSTVEVKHWCLTDDRAAVPEGVEPIDATLPGWWAKVELFRPDMPWAVGDRIAYFDLDLAITGRLEDLVQHPGIIQDEMWPCYNSSVMVWNHGDHANIWTDFRPELMTAPARLIEPTVLPQGSINGGDQEWITECGPWPTFPSRWCQSYKLSARQWPPADAKVILFNGRPKPHECGGWVENVWKVGGFTSLPEMRGVNASRDMITENVRSSIVRDLDWFTGEQPHAKTAVLCCGGPSLKDSLPAIRDHKRRGARIVTVNNTMRFLLEHGITSDCHVMLDARPENETFVQNAPDVRYFLAAQCHPSVFDALKDRRVSLWHNAVNDGTDLEKLVAELGIEKPLVQVPGGGTVGLRAMWLIYFSGFRKMHVYGMDGSYEAGSHHAYPQSINDPDATLEVIMGEKRYVCARWMARQAEEFRATYHELKRYGMQVHVHGRGLIPDMVKAIRYEERAA